MQAFPDGVKPYVVAEIGCNHQGNVDIAVRMIEEAAQAGADAVKFQKRNNKILFRECLYNQIYDNPNSYGGNYGEHRNSLELSKDNYLRIKKACIDNNISLHVTPFEPESLAFCESIGFDAYKLASADIHYPQLIDAISKTRKPIYLSTGGCTEQQLIKGVEFLLEKSEDVVIYHCTSSYPAPLADMNLGYIRRLQKIVGRRALVGLSDHENGIDAATIAYMLGVRVFEKHFTLDRSWKGTDQSFSLEPGGLRKMIRNLNRVELMMGSQEKALLESEKKPLSKMIKTVVAKTNLKKGDCVTSEKLQYMVAAKPCYLPSEIENLVGKTLVRDMSRYDVFYPDCFAE